MVWPDKSELVVGFMIGNLNIFFGYFPSGQAFFEGAFEHLVFTGIFIGC